MYYYSYLLAALTYLRPGLDSCCSDALVPDDWAPADCHPCRPGFFGFWLSTKDVCEERISRTGTLAEGDASVLGRDIVIPSVWLKWWVELGVGSLARTAVLGAVAGSGLKTITTVRNAKTLHYH